MKYGIFGDIHGNLEALEAVLADMEEQGVTHLLCLGDLVGYGANPAECLEVVRALGCPVVRGNHDDLVTLRQTPASFSEAARISLEYARRKLEPSQLNFLRRLPLVHVEDPVTLVHATLDGPESWGYISTRLEAQTCFFYQKPRFVLLAIPIALVPLPRRKRFARWNFGTLIFIPTEARPGENFCLMSVPSDNPGMGTGGPPMQCTIPPSNGWI